MKTVGFEQMMTGLDRLEDGTIEGLYEGLADGVEPLEAAMKETTAYRGMSGATRASSAAYVVGPGHESTAKIEQRRDVAASLLNGFEGHEGQAFLTEVPGPGSDALVVVATVPTDYQIKLETINAGEKAVVGPELDKHTAQLFDAANNGVRRRMRR